MTSAGLHFVEADSFAWNCWGDFCRALELDVRFEIVVGPKGKRGTWLTRRLPPLPFDGTREFARAKRHLQRMHRRASR